MKIDFTPMENPFSKPAPPNPYLSIEVEIPIRYVLPTDTFESVSAMNMAFGKAIYDELGKRLDSATHIEFTTRHSSYDDEYMVVVKYRQPKTEEEIATELAQHQEDLAGYYMHKKSRERAAEEYEIAEAYELSGKDPNEGY